MSANEDPSRRTRIVLITGEPGSGKSILGVELSRALRIPFIARDDVRGGLFFSNGAWSDQPCTVPRADGAVEALLQIAEAIAGLGVSLIVEYVMRRDRGDDLRRLEAVADCVVLHTACTDARSRLLLRERSDRLLNRPAVLRSLGYATIEDHMAESAVRAEQILGEMRTQFDLPTMQVNTQNGFEPDLDQIIAFATAPIRGRS